MRGPATQNYDVNLIYRKGSWVLHMLRHVLGDNAFFDVLKTYATEPTYDDKLLTTEDFQKTAEEVSGLDLNAFFEQWIYKSGDPYYTYSYTSNKNVENNYDVNVTINQLGTIFQMPVDVTIQTATSDTTFVAYVNQQANTFQFTLSDKPDTVILDRGNWILCKIYFLPTAVEENELLPAEYLLSQNYPNPFNPTTIIGFGIMEKGNVRLSVLNILGEEIRILLKEEKAAGYHSINFNASGLPSGVYFYRIQAVPSSGSGQVFIDTKKMLLLK